MCWNLSPQELSDAGCTASLWRSFQEALAVLMAAILPPITLHMLTNASPKMHARLANPKRRRKPAISWPIRRLS
jgi:multisubunit Na+/H+ antiporter MnhG subunit